MVAEHGAASGDQMRLILLLVPGSGVYFRPDEEAWGSVLIVAECSASSAAFNVQLRLWNLFLQCWEFDISLQLLLLAAFFSCHVTCKHYSCQWLLGGVDGGDLVPCLNHPLTPFKHRHCFSVWNDELLQFSFDGVDHQHRATRTDSC